MFDYRVTKKFSKTYTSSVIFERNVKIFFFGVSVRGELVRCRYDLSFFSAPGAVLLKSTTSIFNSYLILSGIFNSGFPVFRQEKKNVILNSIDSHKNKITHKIVYLELGHFSSSLNTYPLTDVSF